MRFAAFIALALTHGALAAPAPNCIRIFQHGVYQGANADLCRSTPNLASIGFNNQLSSAELGSNINRVRFFDGSNYQGDFLTATANVERMGPLGFNDKTSSISIDFKSLPFAAEPHPDCVFVYVDGNYSGVVAEFCDDVPDLGRFEFNNRISSIKLGSNVGRFTVYDDANFGGERRTRDSSVARFGSATFSFNDRTTSLSFLLLSELPTHVAAIDGCDTANTEVDDMCFDVNDEAAVRCCGVGNGDFCDSFCVNPATNQEQTGFLNTYAKALEICTTAGYRLCQREEIEAGDCCGSGCQFDGFNTWIDESCVDSCTSNPCQNGGTCTNIFDGGFTCECASGWEGATCAEDVDDCLPNPCANGQCTDTGTNSYVCTCDSGWMGTNCDVDVDDCIPDPCVNGQCADTGTNSYQCTCDSGWMGTNCDEDVDDCIPDPCVNGQCADTGTNSYECTCDSGWMGTNCDEDVDDCAPNPCQNDGSCTDLGTNSFECDCAIGFTGATCTERTHSPVIDGCNGVNVEVQDECLRKDLLAGVRCCNDTADPAEPVTCDSFCSSNGQLQTYDDAVATCADAGLRLCTRQEIDSRICCGTGCQFDGFQNWISEDCINYCDPHPCENGGTCFNGRVGNPYEGQPSFVCRCTAGWTGATCSEAV